MISYLNKRGIKVFLYRITIISFTIMKKKIMFAALICALFTGCEERILDSPIVDWYPVNITIYATDSLGNSIIQP